jgi:hypothetical protein
MEGLTTREQYCALVKTWELIYCALVKTWEKVVDKDGSNLSKEEELDEEAVEPKKKLSHH